MYNAAHLGLLVGLHDQRNHEVQHGVDEEHKKYGEEELAEYVDFHVISCSYPLVGGIEVISMHHCVQCLEGFSKGHELQ